MILVTGASGFVGTSLVPCLQAAGRIVRPAVRGPHARLPGAPPAVQIGDIGPQTDWRAALRGVRAVVHLAGLAHVLDPARSGNAAPYFRVNTEGTLGLARAAAAAGVRRFVFASSVKVYGEDTDGRVLHESDPARPADPYGESKWRAECELRALATTTGLEVVFLRLPLVHGPGVKANLLRLFEWVDRGVPLPLGALRNRRSLLSTVNLAHAIGLALDHPDAVGETFNVSDGEDVSTPELVRRIAHALGRPARLVPVPSGLLRSVARMAGREADFARLAGDLAIDIARIRERLGYAPVEQLDAGLRRIAAWLRTRAPSAGSAASRAAERVEP